MRRRSFLASASSAVLGPLVAQAPSRPNVLILLADDLGWNDVGYQGSEIRTPNIDRLASDGIRFEQAYSCPVCSPTRSALMTGRNPIRLGLGNTVIRPWSEFGVPLTERFLPQAFREAGYQTAMAGKWHLGHSRRAYLPGSRGFEQTYGHLNGAIDYFKHEREGGLDWARNGKSVREEGYSTFLLGDEAIRFIQQRDRTRPFFFYLPFNSPHTPLQAPPEYLDDYARITDASRRTYAAMVAAMDTTIGRILATLRREGLEQNTIVLFSSDNGGPVAFGANNTPLRAAKGTAFEGGIRVPTTLRWPGHIKPGSSTNQVITAVDYFPTLAAAAAVSPGNDLPFDGLNLWPSLVNGKTQRRDNLFWSVETARVFRMGVRHGNWKLVREIPRDGEMQTYLFDLEEDPNEKTDLSSKNPKITAELAGLAEHWRTQTPENVEPASEPPDGWRAPAEWAEAARS